MVYLTITFFFSQKQSNIILPFLQLLILRTILASESFYINSFSWIVNFMILPRLFLKITTWFFLFNCISIKIWFQSLWLFGFLKFVYLSSANFSCYYKIRNFFGRFIISLSFIPVAIQTSFIGFLQYRFQMLSVTHTFLSASWYVLFNIVIIT